MATLIGDGAHGSDILSDLGRDRRIIIFAHHDDIPADWKGDNPIWIGINDPWQRAAIADALHIKSDAWHHRTVIADNYSTWSWGTHVNYGVTMTRATIGEYVTVSPGVTICGDVTIGDRVLIGAGATICDRVTIGNDVTIGAGAVVLPETCIPDGETWVGVPARCL